MISFLELFTQGSGTQPITVALNNLVNTSIGGKEYNVDMAAAIIAALPTWSFMSLQVNTL